MPDDHDHSHDRGPDFDVAAAHRHFAAHCFNRAWDLIEQPVRTPEEDRLMEALSQASIYHWLQRPDCDARRVSVGHWQASRIQCLLGHADAALRHAQVSLAHAEGLPPFFVGYAHEAMARALALAGHRGEAAPHVEAARALVPRIVREEDRQRLLDDLESI